MLSVELREAVANLYNQQYRQDKLSQYTYENVCIVPGGRAGLSRVAAVIGDVYCVSTYVSRERSRRLQQGRRALLQDHQRAIGSVCEYT